MNYTYRMFLFAISLAILTNCTSNSGYYEEEAIAELDQLSESISELNSLSVMVIAATENQRKESDVYIKGNNKLHVITNGPTEQKGFYYNGQNFTVYNFSTSQFDHVAAPPTTIETIDSINRTFGVRFPAADFFYPTFVDDLMTHFDSIIKLQDADINGIKFNQFMVKNSNRTAFITQNKNTKMPYSLEIFNNETPENAIYAATFTMWQFNPNLADDIFTFSPPENAQKSNFLNVKK